MASSAEKMDDESGTKTAKLAVSVPADLADEIRAAVYSRGHADNLSRFATEALSLLLLRYRKEYNDGRPFVIPQGGVRLKIGRPMKLPGHTSVRRKR